MPCLTLETALDLLVLDTDSGRLLSLRQKSDPEIELLSTESTSPAFALQYLTDDREYRYVDSRSAQSLKVDQEQSIDAQKVTLTFVGVDGLDLDVTLTVCASKLDRFSRWSCSVRNGAGIQIVDVQFPFVVVPLTAESSVLVPAGFGELYEGSMLELLQKDEPRQWQFLPENGNSPHYPGRVFAQFLACYKNGSGVYLSCNDTEGNVKLMKALRSESGLRLGLAHVGDWPEVGERTLEYEVLLSSFTGDWYDAADLYRDWGLQQKWAVPLTQRSDVPQWLLESPPHITIRLQGYLDDGPAPAIEEFLPYEKCIPLLEKIADQVEAPLTIVLMSWERGGPWVYPDCFPPVGGDESLTRFAGMARERGWQVGSFCNGTRWVTQHLFNDYDGREYFEQKHGEESVCRRHDGKKWAEHWDATWRPSYVCCMAQTMTKEIAVDFVRRLIGWGMESIQFFDQNCNAATFACFSKEHGHPSIPGKWMAKAMEEMIKAFRQLAEAAGEKSVIHSTECPCNEYCLPLFQQSDVRVSVPSSGLLNFIPVYHYLYHECTILHGMMSIGPEPYSLTSRNAWNGVLGEITGAVMTGDGTLLNRETGNWALWEPKVGNNEDSLEMIRTMTALRRGAGRDFLVYGRMQRPAEIEGKAMITWDIEGRHHEVPALAHSAWQAPDGRHGVVLANWTTEERQAHVSDKRLGKKVLVYTSARTFETSAVVTENDRLHITIPPLGCVLITSD